MAFYTPNWQPDTLLEHVSREFSLAQGSFAVTQRELLQMLREERAEKQQKVGVAATITMPSPPSAAASGQCIVNSFPESIPESKSNVEAIGESSHVVQAKHPMHDSGQQTHSQDSTRKMLNMWSNWDRKSDNNWCWGESDHGSKWKKDASWVQWQPQESQGARKRRKKFEANEQKEIYAGHSFPIPPPPPPVPSRNQTVMKTAEDAKQLLVEISSCHSVALPPPPPSSRKNDKSKVEDAKLMPPPATKNAKMVVSDHTPGAPPISDELLQSIFCKRFDLDIALRHPYI